MGKGPASLGRHKAKATPGRRTDKHGSSKAAIRQTQGGAGANARTDYAGKTLPCTCLQIQREEPRHKDYDIQSAVCQVTVSLKRQRFPSSKPGPPTSASGLGSKLWSVQARYLCLSLPAERQQASVLCASPPSITSVSPQLLFLTSAGSNN